MGKDATFPIAKREGKDDLVVCVGIEHCHYGGVRALIAVSMATIWS